MSAAIDQIKILNQLIAILSPLSPLQRGRVTDAALRFLQPTAEEDKVVLLAEDNLRLRAAIEAHRECIHGADYNYDEDESYRPEAELYRALKSPRSSGRKISNPKSQIRNSK